ncbi:MAG TPA: hypothetical protein VIY73_02240 [Polyangiaceae bacterium]
MAWACRGTSTDGETRSGVTRYGHAHEDEDEYVLSSTRARTITWTTTAGDCAEGEIHSPERHKA